MIESITNFFLTFEFNSLLAICLYWLPLMLCAYTYLLRTWNNYRKDIASREKAYKKTSPAYYSPTDTVGSLIGRGLVSVIPVANLLAAIFDAAPEAFGNFFRWIGRVFDQPLVPAPRDNSSGQLREETGI